MAAAATSEAASSIIAVVTSTSLNLKINYDERILLQKYHTNTDIQRNVAFTTPLYSRVKSIFYPILIKLESTSLQFYFEVRSLSAAVRH